MKIIDIIKQAVAGHLQKEVAEKAGIRPATLSDILNGKKIPRIDTVEKILAACESLKSETK